MSQIHPPSASPAVSWEVEIQTSPHRQKPPAVQASSLPSLPPSSLPGLGPSGPVALMSKETQLTGSAGRGTPTVKLLQCLRNSSCGTSVCPSPLLPLWEQPCLQGPFSERRREKLPHDTRVSRKSTSTPRQCSFSNSHTTRRLGPHGASTLRWSPDGSELLPGRTRSPKLG